MKRKGIPCQLHSGAKKITRPGTWVGGTVQSAENDPIKTAGVQCFDQYHSANAYKKSKRLVLQYLVLWVLVCFCPKPKFQISSYETYLQRNGLGR